MPTAGDHLGHGVTPRVLVGDVQVSVHGAFAGLAELLGKRLALLVEDVGDDDLRPLSRQFPAGRGLDPTRPAGHERNTAVERRTHDAPSGLLGRVRIGLRLVDRAGAMVGRRVQS